MATLMQANTEWANRPDEERFLSLQSMDKHTTDVRARSKSIVAPISALEAVPVMNDDGSQGLVMVGSKGNPSAISNLAFGQLGDIAGFPKGYIATLPAPIAAMAINHSIKALGNTKESQFLFDAKTGIDGSQALNIRAINTPTYGRIWNSQITSALVARFGDTNSAFKIPGEFGVQGEKITKANTTLYAGDKDMFVFLADETHRLELPNRRGGETGSMSRGFFVSNSEVGEGSLYVASFLFDYMCGNHIVWGVSEMTELRLRHSLKAPERFLDEVQPMLTAMVNEKSSLTETIFKKAQTMAIDDDARSKLFKSLGINPKTGNLIESAHKVEELGRPIETMWDMQVGITAFAKSIRFTADRVAMERNGGKVLDLVKNAA